MQKRCLIIILTLFISIASYSNYHIFHLGRSEGLTSSAVNCIVQDSTGFMWIGTNNGLYRYDGSHFRHYPIPTSKSQSAIYDDRQILSIAIDHHNKIWLSTFHKLFQFDIEKELFTSYVNSDNLDGITRLHVDHNGHIWALGYQGITMIDVTSQKATVPKGSEGLIASDVFESASNELWFTCLDGNLYKYNYHTHQFHPIPILDSSALSQNTTMVSATECERGTIAIATNNSGIYIFRPERPNQLEPLILEGKSIPPSIHTLMYANNGKLYIGTEQGIYIHDFRQKQTHHLKKSHSILPTLSDNAVHSLYIDKNKQVWAGTFFGGIDVICEESSPLTVLYPTAVDGQKIANIVRSIISDNNGHIWVGTEDNGLFTYNPETHQFNSFQPPNISSPFPSNIQGMSCVGNKLLIGTFNRGLFIIDTSTFQQTHHLDRLSSATGVVTEIITYIEPLSMEEALIGTSNGLYVYHLQNSSISHITAFPLAFVHCIHQDVNHHIWIGTINDGLYEMKKDGDNWVVIKKSIPYQTVNCIHSFDDGSLFIGTEGSGVFSYDPSSDQCTPIQLSPKPVNQSICNMITDESNHLWISTSSGLYCYDLDKKHVINSYFQSVLLPNDRFNYSSGLYSPRGLLYFGTYNGMVVVVPQQLQSTDHHLRVHVTGIEGKSVSCGTSVNNTIALPYNESSFSIHYSCPSGSFTRPKWYRYKLVETEDDWTYTSTPHPIHFFNLSPGTYTLYLQASYSMDDWDTPTTSFIITITPPWWKHPIAYILYSLFILGTLFFFLYRYKQYLHKKHLHQILSLQTQKEKETLQEKIRFFTTITHEIRTPLTLILGSIHKMKEQGQTGDGKAFHHLENNSNRLLNLVNQLLDFRKIESQRLMMHFTDLDIIPIIEEVKDNIQLLAQKRHIDLTLETSLRQQMVVADKESVYKMLNNIFGNAIKFSSSFVRIRVHVDTEGEQSTLVIRTDNDGPIIPPSEQKRIFEPFIQHYSHDMSGTIKGSGLGLPLIQSLASLHGGHYGYDNSITSYNSFVLTLPIFHTSATHQKTMVQADDHEEKGNTDTECKPITHLNPLKPNQEKPTILVVDDEDDLRSFLVDELSEHYDIHEASNGKQALNILENNNISLVITDLMMPLMDGMELCNHIRSDIRISHIPIIVLTAKVSIESHIEALNAQADAYVEKPFSTDHLIAQISNLLKSRELLRDVYIHSPHALMGSKITTNKTDDTFMTKLNTYIHDHLHGHSSISIESLCDHLAVSSATLYRKVKGITGLSTKDYIQLCRLQEAAQMLQIQTPIKQVAEELGFSSVSHFTQSFMKQFGITPGKFIKGQ